MRSLLLLFTIAVGWSQTVGGNPADTTSKPIVGGGVTLPAFVEAPVYLCQAICGTNDLVVSGTFTDTTTRIYCIAFTGSNTFTWGRSVDGKNCIGNGPVTATGAVQFLNSGLSVQFLHPSNHTVWDGSNGDAFVFVATPATTNAGWVTTVGPSQSISYSAAGVVIATTSGGVTTITPASKPGLGYLINGNCNGATPTTANTVFWISPWANQNTCATTAGIGLKMPTACTARYFQGVSQSAGSTATSGIMTLFQGPSTSTGLTCTFGTTNICAVDTAHTWLFPANSNYYITGTTGSGINDNLGSIKMTFICN